MGKQVDQEKCRTVSVSEPITSVTAYTNKDDFVNGIVFKTENEMFDFTGDEHSNEQMTWTFDERDILVGMFGKVNRNDKIKQLGWI